MKHTEDRPTRLRMPRSRGAVAGLLLVILGAWGASIPFIGPNFDFGYTPGQAWTAARGWLEVLPGAAAVVGGVLLILSSNRASAMLGGWLAALAGAWFVVGRAFAPLLGIGSVGDPVAATERKRAVLEVAYFSGVGVLIAFLAGAVLSRLAVRLARDVQPLPDQQPVAEPNAATMDMPSPEPSSEAETMPPARGSRAPESAERRGGLFRRHGARV
ncbi:hypothetical protein [Mycobacterium simiae]|uniref:hypothetical protein n=1 Tax=Mycobacterium simiae TaxID=1784 RepID=UPI0021CDC0DC|nr:hypothetical protein [Mycobacterium simiae]